MKIETTEKMEEWRQTGKIGDENWENKTTEKSTAWKIREIARDRGNEEPGKCRKGGDKWENGETQGMENWANVEGWRQMGKWADRDN